MEVTKNAANPQIGFRLVTSGDAIDVDMADCQDGAFSSSPIPTTTAAATRNADVLTYVASGNMAPANVGTVYSEIVTGANTNFTSAQRSVVDSFAGGTDAEQLYIATGANAGKLAMYDGASVLNSSNVAALSDSVQKIAVVWGGTASNKAQTYLNGTQSTDLTFDGSVTSGTNFGVGCAANGTGQLNGTSRNVRIYSVAKSAAQL